MALTRAIRTKWLGRISYGDALRMQETLVGEHLKSLDTENTDGRQLAKNYLLLLEHPPTYTVGKRGEMYDETFEEYLREKGADFHRVNRGGLITFHGPGQLVGYPILRLERRGCTRWYVETLEAAVIDLLAEFGLKGERNPHTGVWIGDNKICAMGINAQREITSHGLAINCNTDMACNLYLSAGRNCRCSVAIRTTSRCCATSERGVFKQAAEL